MSRVIIDETKDAQVIVLKEKFGERSFPIMIGIFEAWSIDRKLRNIPHPRPLTHDLLASVISSLNAQVERIVVTELKDNTFYAKLMLQTQNGVVEVDSRPSDAIALAVRVDAPIFVEEEVLDQASF